MSEQRTLDVLECADFLKVDRTTVLKLAAAGELVGAKIGRSLNRPGFCGGSNS